MTSRKQREREGEPQGRTPQALRTLRPGLSLRKLAKRSGIRLSHLSRVINGRRGLSLKVATLIALHTGTTIERVASVLAPLQQDSRTPQHANGHKPRKKTV